MANYAVDPAILKNYVPHLTELDYFDGKCYVSLVGFMFLDTKVLGLSIPFHRNFEEFNLRFYVRHFAEGEWKRGAVFIKEIVPKPAITWVANTFYGEHYVTLPMRHETTMLADGSKAIEYGWRLAGNWNYLKVKTQPTAKPLQPGSEEEFITEHYWGYTKLGNEKTSEYQVEHPRWEVRKVSDTEINIDAVKLYGEPFGEVLSRVPDSVFVADGSEVLVRRGRKIL